MSWEDIETQDIRGFSAWLVLVLMLPLLVLVLVLPVLLLLQRLPLRLLLRPRCSCSCMMTNDSLLSLDLRCV